LSKASPWRLRSDYWDAEAEEVRNELLWQRS